MGLLVVFKGGPTCATLAVGLKLLKHWYIKEQRNMQLVKENSEAQLQLLTAQVHPHFLFNTLNNIYSQVQTESPKGSKMIMGLSDLLRYILSEGNKAAVPLSKELMMLNEYINLEKVRYGNKLDLHISLPQETGSRKIAPLLLLPFVENCFKHGTSKFLINPWINLKIELKENILIMKLMNGKEIQQMETPVKSGTGIANVKKRLELLYQDKYELQITDEPEVFVVNLKIELTESKSESRTVDESIPALDYA
jgi:LytS/YehU family sensor histidine kinase